MKGIQSYYTDEEIKKLEEYIAKKSKDPAVKISKTNLQKVALMEYIK